MNKDIERTMNTGKFIPFFALGSGYCRIQRNKKYNTKLGSSLGEAEGITSARLIKSLRDLIRRPFGQIFLMKNLGL